MTLRAVVAVVVLAACRPGAPPPGERRAAQPGAALALLPVAGGTALERRVTELQRRVRAAPARVEGWIQLGESWVRQARAASDPALYRAADACADEALRREPGNARALALRGAVLLDAHRFAEARALAAELLRREPDDLRALATLSDAALELGDVDAALRAAQRLLDLKPGLAAYGRAAWLRWLTGDVDGARELHRLAIGAAAGSDPEPLAWTLVQAAMTWWHEGDLAGADAGFDAALAVLAEHPGALAGKGRVALARGEPLAAAGLLERSASLAPSVETLGLLGDARLAAGDPAGAEEAWDAAVRMGRAGDRRGLAAFYATRGRAPAEALRLADEERAVRGGFETEDVYAWSLYRAGRLAEAQLAIARARRLRTPDARLLYHEGAIRLAAGDRAAGLALVRAALRQNPHFDPTGAAEARRLVAAPLARSAR
jgi:tetratricopeptide (TPR) repeat protein